MLTETIRFAGRPRTDGRVYLTSPDMPGFRLLIDPHDHSAETDFREAVTIFYPLHKAAEARKKLVSMSINDHKMSGSERDFSGNFDVVASFAAA